MVAVRFVRTESAGRHPFRDALNQSAAVVAGLQTGASCKTVGVGPEDTISEAYIERRSRYSGKRSGCYLNHRLRMCSPAILSSRPRALPPQPLTDPDVNLSIHPALIVQPQASGPTANVQIGEETAYEAAASTGLHGVGDHETSCISAWPTSQV